MYDQDQRECRDLLVDHPTNRNSDGQPKQVVLCVQWKSSLEGASQYSGDSAENLSTANKPTDVRTSECVPDNSEADNSEADNSEADIDDPGDIPHLDF